MAQGVRYYDKLVDEYKTYLSMPPRQRAARQVEMTNTDDRSYHTLYRMLTDVETKRLLFDARQAEIFSELDEALPHHVQRRLHLPFKQFYMEFTEPVLIGSQQPGYQDAVRAILISDLGDVAGGSGYSKFGTPADMEEITLSLTRATMFLSDSAHTQYIDRTWKFSLTQGIAFPMVGTIRNSDDPSLMPDGSPLPASMPNNAMIPAMLPVVGAEARYHGWWERVTQDYTDLLSWCLTYIMAKSIRIVPEAESRQVRRFRTARNLPAMWHVVEVEPKFYPHSKATGEEPKYHHSYRYDVIGHLRFATHKTREGYSDTIEWVGPHQRGLANELYIPSTHKVSQGKVVSERMHEYFKPDN